MESRGSVSDALSDFGDELDALLLPSTLVYEDTTLEHSALSRLNTLRREGQFCDVTIEVGHHSIAAHRVVLACSSVYLYEAFCAEDHGAQQHLKLDSLDYDSFSVLIDYVYTARLEVPADMVKSVYRTAITLKMDRAAEACAHYLVDRLTPGNCLGIRSFASAHSDAMLTSRTDEYICNNVNSVLNNAEIHRFPHLQARVMGIVDMEDVAERELCNMVVSYFRGLKEEDESLTIDALLENPRVLFLNQGNPHLVDCVEVTDPSIIEQNDIITDYKKKQKYQKQHTPVRSQSSMNGSIHLSLENFPIQEKEWTVIATKPVAAKRCTAIVILDDQLATLGIKFCPQLTRPSSPVGVTSPDSQEPQGSPAAVLGVTSPELEVNLVPLARMSSARCGVGATVIGGQIYALGGYDRGECLDTAEVFSLTDNTWTGLPPMLTARGRFDASQIAGRVYACGGSSGSQELRTAEVYDPETGRWEALPDMSASRSSAGVAVLDNKLYVVGGSSGYTGLRSCEVYDPQTGKWSLIANLNSGRSQCAVSAFQGKLVALGGSDAWNSTNSVEVYDPQANRWSFLTPMATSRRGAGSVVFNDKLYVLGGSDSQSSLTSVEIYDPITQIWSHGPPLTTPRANVAAVAMGDRIFAVGGFSGKMFLDSIEYLATGETEWSSYAPTTMADGKVASGIIAAAMAVAAKMVEEEEDEEVIVNGHCNGHVENGHFEEGICYDEDGFELE